MNTNASERRAPDPANRVLIAIDGSVASSRALTYAQHILPPGAQVRIVSVAENPRTLVPVGAQTMANLDLARAELHRDATDVLSHANDEIKRTDIHVETEVIDLSKHGGDIVDALVDAVDAWQAELLVVGARQHHGLRRWVEGAVSGPLAKFIHCPLLIVPESYMASSADVPHRILFAVDGSALALQALQVGSHYARPDTELRAIYVVDRAVRLGDFVPIDKFEDALVTEGNQALSVAASILEDTTKRSETELLRTEQTGDDIPHAIVREAARWDADLIVMGTHGRRGLAGWIVGSVAGRVARIAQTPVLLVNASPA